MLPDDAEQVRLNARAEGRAGFAVGHGAGLQMIQPIPRLDLMLVKDLLPRQPGPIPEIHFAKTLDRDGARRAVSGDGPRGFAARFIGLA